MVDTINSIENVIIDLQGSMRTMSVCTFSVFLSLCFSHSLYFLP